MSAWYNYVPPSLLCKGKKSFPCGNGFGMGGCENLLTEDVFFEIDLENQRYIKCFCVLLIFQNDIRLNNLNERV